MAINVQVLNFGGLVAVDGGDAGRGLGGGDIQAEDDGVLPGAQLIHREVMEVAQGHPHMFVQHIVDVYVGKAADDLAVIMHFDDSLYFFE